MYESAWSEWSLFWAQFHFIRPMWLSLLVPMFGLLLLRWRQHTKAREQQVLPEHLRNVLTIHAGGWRDQLPLKLLGVITTIAIVVCAGPTWQRQASPFSEDQAALLIVLDNSDSMLQTDVAPTRLERAKQKIHDLLQVRKGGRTGLVVFAGSAHLAMPITSDNQVFAPFLAAISPEIMPLEGKLAEQAFPLIDAQLKQELGTTVLLITDAVNENTLRAYQGYFSKKPYQLLVLMVGRPNVNAANIAPADFDSLQRLAQQTGGEAVAITTDSGDVEVLNRLVERQMRLNGDSSMPWRDMGYGLLFPLVLLLLFWFRKGWLVQWCVTAWIAWASCYFLIMPKPASAEPVSIKAPVTFNQSEVTFGSRLTNWWWDLWLTPDQQGQRWFDQQAYLEAAVHYDDPLRKGVAYYYAREFKLAQSAFLSMQNDPSESMRTLGLYNAASALARQREYVAARELLSSLAAKPSLSEPMRSDVEHNLEVINGIINEINQTSASQANSSDGPESSFELEDSQPRTADGVEENTDSSLMQTQTLDAQALMDDQALADKWLKRVEANPKYFLKAKFQLQLSQPETSPVVDDEESAP